MYLPDAALIKWYALINGRLAKIVAMLFLQILASPMLHAKNIQLIDKNGMPVTNAVIAIPMPSEVSAPAPTEIAIMDQINKQFEPRVLVIKQGQGVSFPNSDDIRHHVYSFSATKPFEIKLFKGAVNQPISFDKPGIVVLGCNIHDQMVGYIYVAHNEQTFVTDRQGQANIPNNINTILVWHEQISAQNTERLTFDLTTNAVETTPERLTLTLPIVLAAPNLDEPVKSTSKFKSKFN